MINYNESLKLEVAESKTHKMTDDELLTMLQDACFGYYWESVHHFDHKGEKAKKNSSKMLLKN
jgi:hypothetical protein